MAVFKYSNLYQRKFNNPINTQLMYKSVTKFKVLIDILIFKNLKKIIIIHKRNVIFD